jgi:hypothetical protein
MDDVVVLFEIQSDQHRNERRFGNVHTYTPSPRSSKREGVVDDIGSISTTMWWWLWWNFDRDSLIISFTVFI